MRSTYRIGNAQTIGNREVQSNYFTAVGSDSVFAVLADGTIDHVNGRRASVLAAEVSVSEFYNKPPNEKWEVFIERLTERIRKEIADRISMGRKPNISLSLLYRSREGIHYYNVGANQIFVFDDREITLVRDGNGYRKINESDMVVMMSEGAYHTLHEVEMIHFLSKKEHPYVIAQRMMESINGKRSIQAMNATILLIEGEL